MNLAAGVRDLHRDRPGGDPAIGFRIGAVQPDSPASTAGLQAGDVVVSVDGTYHGAFGSTSLLGDLRDSVGQTIQLGLERPDGTVESVAVTLRSEAEIDENHGALGIEGPAATSTREAIALQPAAGRRDRRPADGRGARADRRRPRPGSATPIVNRPTEPPPVSGPVGIATQIGDVFWQLGPIFTLYLAGILSANLALVNILPFPPLDGGRMLVIALKRVLGERISLRAERLTYPIGFVFLFGFLIWITYFDIARSLGGGTP